MREHMNSDQAISAQRQGGGGTMSIINSAVGQDTLVLGASFRVELAKDVYAYFGYESELTRAEMERHSF
jgi:hypothetical protein